jgi:hypothetical protein
MPRYFFDVADGEYCPDSEGTELPGLEEARVCAVRLAGQMLTDHPAKFWAGQEWTIEVKDDWGLVLFVLHFTATESPAIRAARQAPAPAG